MRKSRQEAAKTRERIIASAAAEFREHGITATGLADFMKAEGSHMEGSTGTSTVEAYQRELRHFLDWISRRAGNSGPFNAQKQLTKTALQTYMAHLQSENHSISHCARVKSAVGAFARWLIEEKELLRRNPARGVELPPQPLLAPRELSADQRYVLRRLVERQEDVRGEALFALGYWAGCRISDVARLRMEQLHIRPKVGSVLFGYKGGKTRPHRPARFSAASPVRVPSTGRSGSGQRLCI